MTPVASERTFSVQAADQVDDIARMFAEMELTVLDRLICHGVEIERMSSRRLPDGPSIGFASGVCVDGVLVWRRWVLQRSVEEVRVCEQWLPEGYAYLT